MVKWTWETGFLLLLLTILKVSGEFLVVKEENITGTYRKSIEFSFTVNLTSKESITNVNIWVADKTVAVGTADSFNPIATLPPFYDRLSVNKIGNNFNLAVSNLNYSDASAITGMLIYDPDKDDGNTATETITKMINLVVKGGPHLCNDASDLPGRTSVNFQTDKKINITLCGNQKPLLIWTVNNTELVDATSHNTSNLHEYVYSVTLPEDTSLCGNRLHYLATGYEADLRGSTILDIMFKPSISIREVKVDNQCITVTWDKINTGNCSGLQYQVQFVDSANGILLFPPLNQTDSSFKYCLNISNIRIAKVRGVFKTEIGDWVQQDIVFPTTTAAPTTTAPSTTRPVTTTKNGTGGQSDDDDSDDQLYIIIGASLGGLIFLILIILLLIYCCKNKNKKKEFHQMSSFQYHPEKGNPQEAKQNPPSPIIHPTKVINNNDVENGNTNRAYEFTNDRYDPTPKNEEKEFDSTDDEEAHEVVSAAQLKYYDPEEFGLSNSKDEQVNSKVDTATETADKAIPVEVGENLGASVGKENVGYPRDEFDSDEDDYENYNKNFKADQYPPEKYENFESNNTEKIVAT